MKKRAHKGQPKKAPKMKRQVVTIGLNSVYRKRLNALAKKWGASVSEAVRRLIDEHE